MTETEKPFEEGNQTRKPILCVDFDGVIHLYTSPWVDAGTIPDGPVPGALQWMCWATEYFIVTIYSSRSKEKRGIDAMREWMMLHASTDSQRSAIIGEFQFTAEKPPAFLTIDDRALRFDGNWATFPTPQELLGFRPWNKRRAGPSAPRGWEIMTSALDEGFEPVNRADLSEATLRSMTSVMSAATEIRDTAGAHKQFNIPPRVALAILQALLQDGWSSPGHQLKKQSSPELSSLASKVLRGDIEPSREVCMRLAGSVMSQDETAAGQAKVQSN